MYTKIKSEWKTYDEMNAWEQMEFRRDEGWKSYQCRLRSIGKYGTKTFEYLVETWKKVENN